MPSSIVDGLGQSVPALLTAIVTILLGAIVGGRITSGWELAKKRREMDLASAETFYVLYGEFYGIWNEWNVVLHGSFPAVDRDQHRFLLFTRAAAARARMEALLVKIASERELSDDERALLGCYRQAYRTVSKCLESGLPVGVRLSVGLVGGIPDSDYDKWHHSEAISYQTFKELVTAVAALVAQEGHAPGRKDSSESLRIISSNAFERPYWVAEARHRLGLPPAADPRMRVRPWIYEAKTEATGRLDHLGRRSNQARSGGH